MERVISDHQTQKTTHLNVTRRIEITLEKHRHQVADAAAMLDSLQDEIDEIKKHGMPIIQGTPFCRRLSQAQLSFLAGFKDEIATRFSAMKTHWWQAGKNKHRVR